MLLLLSSFTASSEERDPKSYSGMLEMSGYTLNKYIDFEKKWHLVTVRYRKDTGELRYTYANELAWKYLRKDSTDYPDGAVFAKIGLATKEDPAFASSAVPSEARRYQFMVRNKNKYKETAGWGYALFDAEGRTFPGEPHATTLACAACHQLVTDRGHVFSEIVELSPFKKQKISDPIKSSKIWFETIKTSSISQAILNHLPINSDKVRILRGPLGKNSFQGTLDEIRPTLINEVQQSSLPALFVNEKGSMFSVVFLNQDKKGCAGKNELAMIGLHSIDFKKSEVFNLSFCHKH
jgi:hypothetical protein